MNDALRTEALEMARQAGRLSKRGPAFRCNYFDCSATDESDTFENYRQNAHAACERAGITEDEMSEAYDAGYLGR
jgi:hypothetical protein